MRRLVIALAGLILSTALGSATAIAQENAGCVPAKERDTLADRSEVVCAASARSTLPGADVRARAPSRTSLSLRPVPDIVRVPQFGNVAPVGLCRQRGTITIPRQELALPENVQLRIWMQIVNTFEKCPTVQVDPEDVATAVLERVPLPAPSPAIAPGWAITGKAAFLEPNLAVPLVAGRPTVTENRGTELGAMAMTATAVYRVDWGDVETGPHAGPGGPWPGGNITHTWTDHGVYDVVVTAVWTVDWRLGGASGRFSVPTEGTIADFRVEQLQAVRNR